MVESRALIPGSGMGGGLVTQPHPALLQSEFTPDSLNMQFSKGGACRRPGLAPFALGAIRGGAIHPVVKTWRGEPDDSASYPGQDVLRREWGGCLQIGWCRQFENDHLAIYFNYTPTFIDLHKINRVGTKTVPYRQSIIGVPWVKGDTGYATLNGWRWQIGIAYKSDVLFGGSPPPEGDYFFFLRVDKPGMTGSPTNAIYIHCNMPVQVGMRYEVRVRMDKLENGKFSYQFITCREDGYCCHTDSGELSDGWDEDIKKPIQVFGPYHPDVVLTEATDVMHDIPAEGVLERLVFLDGSLIGNENDPLPNLFGMSQRVETERFEEDLADAVIGYWPGESDLDGWVKDYGPQGHHAYYVPSRATVRVEERPAVQLDPFHTMALRAFSYHSDSAIHHHTEQDILNHIIERYTTPTRKSDGSAPFDFLLGGTFELDGKTPFGWREGRHLLTLFGDDPNTTKQTDEPYPWYLPPMFQIGFTTTGDIFARVVVGSTYETVTFPYSGDLTSKPVRILCHFIAHWDTSTTDLHIEVTCYLNGKSLGTRTVTNTSGNWYGGVRWLVAGPFAGKVYDIQILGKADVADPLPFDSPVGIEDLDLPEMFYWRTSSGVLWSDPPRSTRSYLGRDCFLIPESWMKDLTSQDKWASFFSGNLQGPTITSFTNPDDGTSDNIAAEVNGKLVAVRVLGNWVCQHDKVYQPKLPSRLAEIRTPMQGTSPVTVQDYWTGFLTGNEDDFVLKSQNDLFGDLYIGTLHTNYASNLEIPASPLAVRHWPLFFHSHHDLGVEIRAGELIPAEKDHGVRLLFEAGDKVIAGAGRILFVREPYWRKGRGLTLFGRNKSYWWGPAGIDMIPQHENNYSDHTTTFAFRYCRGHEDSKRRLLFSIGRVFWKSKARAQLPLFWVEEEAGQLIIRGRHYASGVETEPFSYRTSELNVASTDGTTFADGSPHWVVIQVDPDASVASDVVKVWVDGLEVYVWNDTINPPMAQALPSGVECDVVVFGGNPWPLHKNANPWTTDVFSNPGKGWIEEFYCIQDQASNLKDYGLSLGGGWHGSASLDAAFAGDFRQAPAGDYIQVSRSGGTGYVRLRGSDLVPVSSSLPCLNGTRPKAIQYGEEIFLACESGAPRRIFTKGKPFQLSSSGWEVDFLGLPKPPLTVLESRLVSSSSSGKVGRLVAASTGGSLPSSATYSVYISFYDQDRDAHSDLIYMGQVAMTSGSTTYDSFYLFFMPRLAQGKGTHTYIWVNDGTGYQLARVLTGTDATHCLVRNIDYQGRTIDFEYGEPPVARTLEMASGRLVLGGLSQINDRAYAGSGAGNPYVFPAENYVVAGSADSGKIVDLVHVLGRILIVHPRRLSWLTIPGPWSAVREDQVTGYKGFISVHEPKRLENIVAGMTEDGPAILQETVLVPRGNGIKPSLEGLLGKPWVLTSLPQTGEVLFISEGVDGFSKIFSLIMGESEIWAKWEVPSITSVASAHLDGVPVQLVGTKTGKVFYFLEQNGDGISPVTNIPKKATITYTGVGSLFKATPVEGSFKELSPDAGAGLVFATDEKAVVGTCMEGDSHIRWATGDEQYFRFEGDPITNVDAAVGGIQAYWTSPWLDFGMPTRAKKVSRLWLMFEAVQETLKVLWTRAVNREAKKQALTRSFPSQEDGFGEIDMTYGVMESPLQIIEGRGYGVYFRFKVQAATREQWWLFKYFIEGELAGMRAE